MAATGSVFTLDIISSLVSNLRQANRIPKPFPDITSRKISRPVQSVEKIDLMDSRLNLKAAEVTENNVFQRS